MGSFPPSSPFGPQRTCLSPPALAPLTHTAPLPLLPFLALGRHQPSGPAPRARLTLLSLSHSPTRRSRMSSPSSNRGSDANTTSPSPSSAALPLVLPWRQWIRMSASGTFLAPLSPLSSPLSPSVHHRHAAARAHSTVATMAELRAPLAEHG